MSIKFNCYALEDLGGVVNVFQAGRTGDGEDHSSLKGVFAETGPVNLRDHN